MSSVNIRAWTPHGQVYSRGDPQVSYTRGRSSSEWKTSFFLVASRKLRRKNAAGEVTTQVENKEDNGSYNDVSIEEQTTMNLKSFLLVVAILECSRIVFQILVFLIRIKIYRYSQSVNGEYSCIYKAALESRLWTILTFYSEQREAII